jgi:hypothetical protein
VSATVVPGTQVVTGKLHRVRRGRGKRFSAEPPPAPPRRPARVAVTLALAHTIQRAIDRGEIRDQAEAARMLGVTRARITQILDLRLLAPDLQERLLSQNTSPVASMSTHALRTIAFHQSWTEQRKRMQSATERRAR